MSDLFKQIQSTLRDIKDNHDIDMQSPRGARIGSVNYPAYNKNISVHEGFGYHDFEIPFENGHYAEWHMPKDANDKLLKSHIYNMVPLHKPDGVYEQNFYGWFHTPGKSENSSLEFKPGDHTNIHETLGRWSVLPSKGLIHIGDSKPFTDWGDTTPITRDMTEEELQQHHRRPRPVPAIYRNAFIKPPYGPELIHVSYRNDKGHSKLKSYNIRTEELRDVWPKK